MTVKRVNYEQVYDGEWFRPVMRKFYDQCCHCGLVHTMDFRVVEDGGIEFRAKVNKRATAAVRRAARFKKADRRP